jgi:hypothetical protein
MNHQHRYAAHLRLASGADERAPGGAATAALCGHWVHEGECRWPHLTSVRPAGGLLEVTVEFDAPDHECDEVTARIREALGAGALVGPDVRLSKWEVVPGGQLSPGAVHQPAERVGGDGRTTNET